MRIFFLLILNFFIFQNTFADDCAPAMNLKNPLSIDYPRDQDSTGWCYAYTAADLISFATGENVSAIYLSLLQEDRFLYKALGIDQGGFIDSSIRTAMEKGYCSEKEVSSMDFAMSLWAHNTDLNSLYQLLNSLAIELEANVKGPLNADSALNYICKESSSDLLGLLKKSFPKLTEKQIAQLLVDASGRNAMKKLVDASCSPKKSRVLESFKIVHLGWNSLRSKIWTTIDEQLTKGNIIGVNLKADKLLSKSSSGSLLKLHAVSIVGRRFNQEKQRCEYLIRNSWGRSCDAYPPDFECESGHVWVPRDHLKDGPNVISATYLEKN